MAILVRVSCILVLMMAGFISVRCDFAQDKKQCQQQLVGLSPCLGFISGKDKDPSSTCCLDLTKNFNQTHECLCILIRDRNEPELGLTINGTLALTLPFVCHIQANETQCLDFLHLDPRSPEAQIFEQFANASRTRSGSGNDKSSSNTIRVKIWHKLGMACCLSLWLLIPGFITHY